MTAAFRTHAYAAARRPERNAPHSGPVTVITVLAEVWSAALVAADGDPTRIIVVSPTEVIIINRSRSKRR